MEALGGWCLPRSSKPLSRPVAVWGVGSIPMRFRHIVPPLGARLSVLGEGVLSLAIQPFSERLRRAVVGAAGHVDHGKTQLIEAPAGVTGTRFRSAPEAAAT